MGGGVGWGYLWYGGGGGGRNKEGKEKEEEIGRGVMEEGMEGGMIKKERI